MQTTYNIRMRRFTAEQKAEIIAYAETNGIFAANNLYDLYSDTIKYWTDPDHRKKVSERNKKYVSKPRKVLTEEERKIAQEKRKLQREMSSEETKAIKREYVRQHRLDNLERYMQMTKANYEKNKVKYRALGKADYEKNKLHYFEVTKQKYHAEPATKLRSLIRNNLNRALDGTFNVKEHCSLAYLGCTVEEFKQYITSKFTEGMSWDNHGRGENCWHLDHIKPLQLLKDAKNQTLLKELCHYTNYQPLWEKDNLAKSYKLL